MIAARLLLSELNQAIRDTLAAGFEEPIWVVAEIARVNANYSGHTYLDLVEKRGSETLAQAKATIWRSNSRILAAYASAAGAPLAAGVQVLLLVRVDYHPVYGLSLNVQEIDPSYTLGEMARKRQEVLNRLQAEDLLSKNGRLALPIVPQRVAVITSATAAGWEDFRKRLESNLYGYAFALTLYPAVVQGEGAESSILAALSTAAKQAGAVDAAVIIRGGGGVVDLSCFDSYAIARAIALFPVPVITGIGHERDTSVADIVAHHRADTPTAAAEFLVNRILQFDSALQAATDRLVDRAQSMLQEGKLSISTLAISISEESSRRLAASAEQFGRMLARGASAVRSRAGRHAVLVTELSTRLSMRAVDRSQMGKRDVDVASARLAAAAAGLIKTHGENMAAIYTTVRLYSPREILKRGFSITRVGGKAIRSVTEVGPGFELKTEMHDGNIASRVEEAH